MSEEKLFSIQETVKVEWVVSDVSGNPLVTVEKEYSEQGKADKSLALNSLEAWIREQRKEVGYYVKREV